MTNNFKTVSVSTLYSMGNDLCVCVSVCLSVCLSVCVLAACMTCVAVMRQLHDQFTTVQNTRPYLG